MGQLDFQPEIKNKTRKVINLMQLRKLAASALGALMTGATLAFPAVAATMTLDDYPAPFVSDSEANFSIVVGSDAAAKDVASAIDVAVTLGGQPTTTETKAAAAAAAQWSATNGEALNTVNDNLYLGDAINKATQTLTDDDLSMLADGTVSTDDNDYDYQQFLEVKSVTPGIATGDGDDKLTDDALITQVPESADSPSKLYTLKVSFTQAFNATEAAEDSSEIELFGKTYTVDSTTNLDGDGATEGAITLFGSAQDLQISTGESATFTTDGTEHTISVSAVNTDGVVYSVDGGAAAQENVGYDFDVDGTTVKIDSMINLKDDSGSATFAIGSEKLILDESNGQVQVGEDEEDIDNTVVTITEGTQGGEVTEISIEVGAPNNDVDDIQAGEEFTDTVFGTVSYAFGGISPEFKADERSNIDLAASSEYAEVTVTGAAGNEKTLTFAKGTGTWGSITFSVEDDGGNSYSIVEGTEAGESDYVIVDQGDFEHLLQVTNVDVSGASDDTVEFEDVFTEASYSVTGNMSSTQQTMYIDGQPYKVEDVGADGTDVAVTWDTSEKTVFPVIEDENGAKVAITDQVTGIANQTTVELPTIDVTLGSDVTDDTTAYSGSGQVEYDFAFNESGNDNWDINLNATTNPAVLVLEEEDDDNNQSAVIVPVKDSGDSDDEMDIGSPVYTKSKTSGALDNDDSIEADLYGTYSVSDDDSEFVDIYYPDNQATIGVGFLEEGGSLTVGGGGEVTCTDKIVPITSSVVELDTTITEGEKTTADNNLILVGGPCVNLLVSDLLLNGNVNGEPVLEGVNPNATTCDARWNDAPELQLVEDAFATDQTALVVAGATREGTSNAAAALQEIGALPDAATKDV